MSNQKKTTSLAVKQTRKRNPPRTAFKPGNEHRFTPGVSGNPTGKAANDLRLVSKSLREQLNTRAPDDVAKAVGAGRGASWAQCVSASLLRSAVAGDSQAARLIIETIEGKAPQSLSLGGLDGEPLFPSTATGPMIHVHFVESDGDGAPKIIDG